MPTLFLIIVLLLSHTQHLSSSSTHHRKILHQPFFPLDSLSPTQPPSTSPLTQIPKFPFSSTSSSSSSSNRPPFFPYYPSSPSPPSSATLATFPANISSLLFPNSHSSPKPISRKLVAVAVSVSLFSAALIAATAALLLYHRRRSTGFPDTIRLFPPDTAASDGGDKHTSEFLYLGTLINSRGTNENDQIPNAAAYTSTSTSTSTSYRKLGSPELHPLPPLPRQNLRHNNNNEDEEDEFFSPSESPICSLSSGRKVLRDVEVENLIAKSPSYQSSSNSASPSQSSQSMSPELFRQNTASPLLFNSSQSSQPMSPELFRQNTASPLLFNSSSPGSSKSMSPELNLLAPNTGECECVSGSASPPILNLNLSPRMRVPPLPPPLPPPRFWETPPTMVSGPRLPEMERPKLKPLHWDKVRASSDRAMVWDQLKFSSFQLNEEMIETLFTVNGSSSSLTAKDNTRRPVLPPPNQENQVLDPKKSQNIAILLRALNVTIDEVCEALLEGNTDTLGTELLESLLKMAPTKEEERNLKEFKDEESPFKLGPAERFLKAVLDVPFAFRRVDVMLYIANFDSEIEYLKRSFETLEAACHELRNSRMLMKLLEAVLMTGNRMNVGTTRGDAHAFKLDTLLKLVDVKGTDGKTTVLHFVVQEIIRSEGSCLSEPSDDFHDRKLGLQVVSSLSGELSNVKKSAAMDSDSLSKEVSKLGMGMEKIREIVEVREETKFWESMSGFLRKAEAEIVVIKGHECGTFSLVKEITEYFHGNSAMELAHPFRIFSVVRDFLTILDGVCKEVGKINQRTMVSSGGGGGGHHLNSSHTPVFPVVFNAK